MTERRRRVVWTAAAARDLQEIVLFVAGNSPRPALRLLERLQRRADRLATAPGRGRPVPELAAYGLRGWRELIEVPYRIVYRVPSRGPVLVAGIFDGRRDLRDILLERLTHPGL